MATASAGRATRVRRGRPRVPRALAARRSSGSTTGQGRKQARGQTPLVSRDAVSIASDLELELGCRAYRPPKADCRRFNGSLSVAAWVSAKLGRPSAPTPHSSP